MTILEATRTDDSAMGTPRKASWSKAALAIKPSKAAITSPA